MCEENRLELETERYGRPNELTYYTVHGSFLKMTKFSFYTDDWDSKLFLDESESPEPRNQTACWWFVKDVRPSAVRSPNRRAVRDTNLFERCPQDFFECEPMTEQSMECTTKNTHKKLDWFEN